MEPEYLGVPVLSFQDFRIPISYSKILECVDFETFRQRREAFILGLISKILEMKNRKFVSNH